MTKFEHKELEFEVGLKGNPIDIYEMSGEKDNDGILWNFSGGGLNGEGLWELFHGKHKDLLKVLDIADSIEVNFSGIIVRVKRIEKNEK